jgi:hypothetical protein
MTLLAPCEPGRVTTPISYSFEQGTLPTTSLISKQAIPYRTRGGTCCPRVSTHKIRSLEDSSMTNHITCQNSIVSTILAHAQTTTSILTTVKSHLDGWKTISHKDTSQNYHHKGWKHLYDTHDCMAKHD